MMSEKPVPEATELVILVSTALLGAVLGMGIAFGLWTQLHESADGALVTPAVAALGLGLSLTGFALPRFTSRVFLLVLGLALVAAFFLGAPIFRTLAP